MNKDKKSLLIISVIILLFTIPYLNMAYHVDADWFMDIADQIVKNPLRAYSGYSDIGSFSGIAKNFDGNSTPLVSYYLAFIFLLFGHSEIAVHASYILFYLMIGFSFYYLSKRFVSKPLLSTLILISTVSFVVMSHNIMLDVPMMGILLVSITLFIYGVDKGNHLLMAVGSIFAGFAYLAKPNGIISVPLLILYALLRKKYKYIPYIFVSISLIALWSWQTYAFEHRIWIIEHLPHLYKLKSSLNFNIVAAYIFTNISYIGGATIFPFFFLYPFILEKRNKIILGLTLLFMTIVSIGLYFISSKFVSGQYTIFHLILFVSFTTSFAFFIINVLVEYRKEIINCTIGIVKNKHANCNNDLFFLLVWLFGIYLFNSIISGGSAKYVTLIIPPLILVFSIISQQYATRFQINHRKLLLVIFLTSAIVSIAVSYADYQYADVYRDFSYNIAKKFQTESNTVWYNGFYGFRYYMRKQNHPILSVQSNEPKVGDFVIVARIPSPRPLSEKLKKRINPIQTISYKGGFPIRTQSPISHAGFYTYGGGFLPYSFSNGNLESFDVYYVNK